MANVAQYEIDYIAWQNRATRFYLGTRLLYQKKLYAPAAYSAVMTIELLLKATLVFHSSGTFNPSDAGHGIAKMARMVNNKVPSNQPNIPSYFYHEQRYLSTSRYVTKDRGLTIPNSFLDDLDRVFSDLISLTPFQYNSGLKRAISGKNKTELAIIRTKNLQMRKLRKLLNQRLTS